MYSVARSALRPPHMLRLPRNVPLSRLKGATPTKAAICLRLSSPSSGSSARRLRDNTAPTPGTLRSNLSFSHQTGLSFMAFCNSLLMSPRQCSNHTICALMLGFTNGGALLRRFFSAVSILTSCRRRAVSAWRCLTCLFLRGRGWGLTASPKRANIWASMVSVLANLPVALAKFRTWRGLTTTTGRLAAAKAVTTAASKLPVASKTIRRGCRGFIRFMNVPIPSSSLSTDQVEPPGMTATSKLPLETSIPTMCSDVSILRSPFPNLADTGSPWPRQLFGLFGEGRGDPCSPTDLAHSQGWTVCHVLNLDLVPSTMHDKYSISKLNIQGQE
jgi:hypothetical protein